MDDASDIGGADRPRRAADLLARAYARQMAGDLDEAIDLYTQSIEAWPTAEAFTFRGWTRSARQELDQAIDDCHRAIEVDPGFGNPYNDIGAYLIQLGRHAEAVPWLRKATVAPRYESRCFPWANLGRVYEAAGQWRTALGHYRRALRENPDYPVALEGLGRMRACLN